MTKKKLTLEEMKEICRQNWKANHCQACPLRAKSGKEFECIRFKAEWDECIKKLKPKEREKINYKNPWEI